MDTRAVVVAGLIIAVSEACSGAVLTAGGQDSASFSHQGFFFAIGGDAHHASTSLSGGACSSFDLGVGYVVLQGFELQVDFLTGSENIPQNPHTPISGRIPMGGASFDARIFLSTRQALHPFALVGYDLSSLLDNGTHGYSGGGPRLALGLQLEPSSSWAVSVQVGYASIRFHDVVAGTDPAGIFQAFTDHRSGVAVHVHFYPNLLP